MNLHYLETDDWHNLPVSSIKLLCRGTPKIANELQTS
jgi:hypothetical protein